MNKTNVALGILALIIVGALGFTFLNINSSDSNTSATNNNSSNTLMETSEETPMTQQPAQETSQESATGGTYANYSKEAVANAEGDVYLFFHAPWCPQCRSIESGITSQGVPDGVTILKVDYDTNQGLRQKYGVTIQTTFVKVDKNGNKVSDYVAYNEPTFDAVKRDFIN